MSVVIIIGGSGGAKHAVDQMNQAASQNNWTSAQVKSAEDIFKAFMVQCDSFIANPQPPE